jgi:hypothetical protein
MGTRSRIGMKLENGTIKSIYCHLDGYPEYVGAILKKHYTNPEKIAQLLELGDISSLGPEIGKQHPFSPTEAHLTIDAYDKMYGKMTRAYGRDRGETNIEAQISRTKEEFLNISPDAEYAYLFVNNKWTTKKL